MVPVLPLLVDPLDQRVGGGVRMHVHGHAISWVSICHMRHMCDGALAIATWHIVVVKVVMRHDELVR